MSALDEARAEYALMGLARLLGFAEHGLSMHYVGRLVRLTVCDIASRQVTAYGSNRMSAMHALYVELEVNASKRLNKLQAEITIIQAAISAADEAFHQDDGSNP
jgi:hypothetical protein